MRVQLVGGEWAGLKAPVFSQDDGVLDDRGEAIVIEQLAQTPGDRAVVQHGVREAKGDQHVAVRDLDGLSEVIGRWREVRGEAHQRVLAVEVVRVRHGEGTVNRRARGEHRLRRAGHGRLTQHVDRKGGWPAGLDVPFDLGSDVVADDDNDAVVAARLRGRDRVIHDRFAAGADGGELLQPPKTPPMTGGEDHKLHKTAS